MGHWMVLGKLKEQAGDQRLQELVEWALPIQERAFEDVKAGSLKLAAEGDPSSPPERRPSGQPPGCERLASPRMAARRPSGKAMLAGAAALAAIAGGGAAAWVAAGDDDNPPANGPMAVATAPGSAQSDTESELGVPPQTQPGSDPPQPTPSTGEGGGDEQPSGSAGAEATLGKTETTRVPRKRRQSRAKAKRFAIPPAREFSGTGNARLGTVEIGAPSVVKWSTKGRFELRFGREAFPIIAPSASGQLVVPPYSFDQVRVIADGRWKISITPQK